MIALDMDQFRRLWESGVTKKHIAKVCRISESTVRRVAMDNDMPPRPERPETDDQLRRLWQDGRSINDIRRDLHMGYERIRDAVARLGLPPRQLQKGGKRGRKAPSPTKPKPGEDRVIREPVMRKAPHPNWTDIQDVRIFETRGKYAAIAALSADIGRSMPAILARWHQIRGQ